MRILVSGGGSAGHISPTLATVDALKQSDKNIEILYVGSKGSLEHKIVRAAGIEYVSISAGKLRRYHGNIWRTLADTEAIRLNIRDIARVIAGVFQSLRIINAFRPDAIFIKGGYVGLPVGIAARLRHVPYIIHESDIEPGLTNRILSRWAEKIAVGFPEKNYKAFPKDRLIFTGSPVRREIVSAHRLDGLSLFKLNDKLPVVLVTGGSQGAQALNEVLIKALPQLLEHCQIIHVTGERHIEYARFAVKQLKLKRPERYFQFSYLTTEMGPALAASDVVVTRAGANTIAELALLNKPTILVPNYLQAGHQVMNARVASRLGAARVLTEDRLTEHSLTSEIISILQSEETQIQLAKNIQQLAVPDAAEKLAEQVISIAPKEES